HFVKWDLRGNTWWRGQFPIQSYEEEKENMRIWIKSRMKWLDENLQNTGACGDWPTGNAENIIISTFPNPFIGTGYLFIKSREAQGVTIEVINIMGRKIVQTTKSVFKGDNKVPLDGQYWPAGVYQIIVTSATGEKSVFRLIKQ
ncbi:MAG: T9SS type A sorting domain-containing protein, partial [Chitinophagaceae bacterium]